MNAGLERMTPQEKRFQRGTPKDDFPVDGAIL
jgi:hypothetical protein